MLRHQQLEVRRVHAAKVAQQRKMQARMLNAPGEKIFGQDALDGGWIEDEDECAELVELGVTGAQAAAAAKTRPQGKASKRRASHSSAE